MRSPARSTYAYLTLVGVLLVVVLAGRMDFGGPGAGPGPDDHGRAGQKTQPGVYDADGRPSPRRLNDLWAAYGHAATCSQWSGADGMQAIRLNHDKVAWFFSDTFLGPVSSDGSRPPFGTSMIQNSLVVQTTGTDGRNRMNTVTGGNTCGGGGGTLSPGPQALLPRPVQKPRPWYWAADNAIAGNTLVKFYNRFHSGGPRYIPEGTVIARFPIGELTASTPPAAMRPPTSEIPPYTPVPGGSPILWGGAVLADGPTTYVYGWETPDVNVQEKRLYLARVPSRTLADFGTWRFYAGAGRWTGAQAGARPLQPPGAPLSVSNGFTVAKIGGRYWLIQHEPDLFDPDIVAYPAATPWGPFDRKAGQTLNPSSTLTGYRRGSTHQWKVVPVNVRNQTGPPITIRQKLP